MSNAKNSYLRAQLRSLNSQKQKRNNAAGPARSEHQIATTGLGQIRLDSAIKFEMPFIYEPQVSSGCAIIKTPRDLTKDPQGNAVIRSWVRDAQGNYTQAWVTLFVDIDLTAGQKSQYYSKIEMLHFLTFSGVGFKPLDGIDNELEDLSPLEMQL
jgi:hypothetical protein